MNDEKKIFLTYYIFSRENLIDLVGFQRNNVKIKLLDCFLAVTQNYTFGSYVAVVGQQHKLTAAAPPSFTLPFHFLHVLLCILPPFFFPLPSFLVFVADVANALIVFVLTSFFVTAVNSFSVLVFTSMSENI